MGAVGWVEVAGRRVWHETLGEGSPLVLLHGGFGDAASLAPLSTAFARRHRVFVPERRGHGHTPEREPLTYAAMADDLVDYLRAVVHPDHGPATLVGWSDGAVVALLAAESAPDLVAQQALVGQFFERSGAVDLASMLATLADAGVASLLRRARHPSADGPEGFEGFHARMLRMLAAEPEIPAERLRRIGTRTLVVQGDRDEVRLEHSVAVAADLPDARLAVLPGTHLLPLEQPELLVSLVEGWASTAGPG